MKKFLTLCIILSIAFCWVQSAVPSAGSQAESDFICGLLGGIIGGNLLRKIAHFTEYGIVAFFLALYFVKYKEITVKKTVNLFLTGLVVAFIDETIQLFSGRGAQISDVWIDFAGFFAVATAVHVIWLTARNKASKTEK